MSNHPFNQQAFDAVDPQSRETVINFFNKLGYNFQNGTQYGVDLIDETKGIALELENRSIWNEGEYPYSSYHYLARKKHFYEDTLPYKVFFVVINKSFTRGLMIAPEAIKRYLEDYQLVTVKCGGRYNDDFYHVPYKYSETS